MAYGMPLILIIGPDHESRHGPLETVLRDLGLPYSFLAGVFPSSPPADYASDRCVVLHGRPLTLGELGCAQSHAKAYHQLLQSPWQFALIFEDDARILDAQKFLEFLKLVQTLRADDPLVISLYSGLAVVDPAPQPFGRRCMFPPAHAVAYLINRRAAEELIIANKDLTWAADWPYAAHVKFFLWKNHFIQHGDHESSSLIWRGHGSDTPQPKRLARQRIAEILRILSFMDWLLNREHYHSLREWVDVVLRRRIIGAAGRRLGRREAHGEQEHFVLPKWLVSLLV